MPKTIKQYEWLTRLGSVTQSAYREARSLRGFKAQFPERLEAHQHELIDQLANSFEQLGIMVKEIEDELEIKK